jgi:hypothetical protein
MYGDRMMNTADLIATQRSAAMAPPNTDIKVHRDDLIEIIEELLDQRRLLHRVGTDLKTIARRAPLQPK